MLTLVMYGTTRHGIWRGCGNWGAIRSAASKHLVCYYLRVVTGPEGLSPEGFMVWGRLPIPDDVMAWCLLW